MDSKSSENAASLPLRRSTRQSTGKVLSFEPTPRGPLKRTKRGAQNQAPAPAVNGSREAESGSDDKESPSKKPRLETAGEAGGSGDENEMDVQEEDPDKPKDQEMDLEQDFSQIPPQPKTCKGALGDGNLSPCVMLSDIYQPSNAVNKAKTVKPPSEVPVAPTKPATQIRSPVTRHDVQTTKITSMEDYRRTMESKIKTAGTPAVNHIPKVYPASEISHTTRKRGNNVQTRKGPAQDKNQGSRTRVKEEPLATPGPRVADPCSRGCMWYFCGLVLLLLLSFSAVLLARKIIPVLRRTGGRGGLSPRAVKPEKFADHLTLLETKFPSQHPELWKRSKIHLERHLETAQPTEPVSLILTAGLRAERTLHCLAQGMASSFSSALNVSVLQIDGASKAGQDSDKVKLDVDSQLRAAFEGDKPVAVIHRFEELPPGSTLIFYRYCDHENAAYKQVFLLFTVLLPQDEVRGDQSLKEVEEMVHDYLKERLVGSTSQSAFNMMDTDKYGGLWSRISHLVLPVVSENDVEQKGC